MDNIKKNLQSIRARIASASARVSRPEHNIKLLAVSKKQTVEKMQAYQKVCREQGLTVCFGENYLQEYKQKAAQLKEKSEVHMIGALQSNKAAEAVEIFDVIESVHSGKLAHAINRRAIQLGKRQAIFLQVNISNDEDKSGFDAAAVIPFIENDLVNLKGLELQGLMTITRLYDSPELARPDFRKMRELREQIQKLPACSRHLALSMGMSDDFEIAIEEGADIIRVGTLLFGNRQ